MLVEGLQNGVPYTVVLLAIDFAGNATGTYFTTTITPQPAIDFWEDLHNRGSNTEGGFCLMASTAPMHHECLNWAGAMRRQRKTSSFLYASFTCLSSSRKRSRSSASETTSESESEP